jgi:DNA (cytosine-5)-methyltransferase 1
VAAWIGKRLHRPGAYDRARDGALLAPNDWPRAARLAGAERREVRISDFPTWRRRKPLHEFLQFDAQLLSARATAGFLSRVEKSSLRFVPGFKDRVRAHLDHVRTIDRFVGDKTTSLIAAE